MKQGGSEPNLGERVNEVITPELFGYHNIELRKELSSMAHQGLERPDCKNLEQGS